MGFGPPPNEAGGGSLQLKGSGDLEGQSANGPAKLGIMKRPGLASLPAEVDGESFKNKAALLSALPPPPIPAGVIGFRRELDQALESALKPSRSQPNLRENGKDDSDSDSDSELEAPMDDLATQVGANKRAVVRYKKRAPDPAGEPLFNFMVHHTPGWLPVPPDDASVPNLPAKSGTAQRLRPPTLHAASAVPPPEPEPLSRLQSGAISMMAEHDAQRLEHPERVMNMLVYDSLEPPPAPEKVKPATGEDEKGPDESPEADAKFWYNDELPPWRCPAGPDDTTLVFESRFESGNLRRVLQVYENEYDLILRPDINTRAHTQWFFFAVCNTRAGRKYKFNIINLVKDDSLYNDGMLPLVHSSKTMALQGLGWHRSGENVAYYANTIRRGRSKRYHTLTFTLTFAHDHDTIHVAHCYPYTYTDLQRYLHSLMSDPRIAPLVQRSTLCSTLAGNTCDILTITSPTENSDKLRKRRGVVISARVHPGETNASWMMKGVLDYLVGPSLDARLLRETFIFKVIPMLNPDGVIVGNYRCSLAGVDLNRVWNEPSRRLHPTIWHAKATLRAFLEEREVVLFCDLHGHSRKRNIFIYGCEKLPKDLAPAVPGWPVPGSVGGAQNVPMRHQDKVFPLLLHHNTPDKFSFRHCNFRVQKSKSGTGRVVGFRELGLVNSFTLEASFCGAARGRLGGLHFSVADLEDQGAGLVVSLMDYADPEQYGWDDLLAELEFLYPASGETPHYVTSPDGQLVEVDEEDLPTDSDDESSEDGDAERKARARRSQQGGPSGAAGRGPGARTGGGADPYDVHNGATLSSAQLVATAADSSGVSPGIARLLAERGAEAAGQPGAGGASSVLGGRGRQGAAHSDSEAQPSRRAGHGRTLNAFLRAQRDRATSGLAEMLPVIAARGSNARDGGQSPQPGPEEPGGAGAGNARRPSLLGAGVMRPPAAVEYARSRGIYGETAAYWDDRDRSPDNDPSPQTSKDGRHGNPSTSGQNSSTASVPSAPISSYVPRMPAAPAATTAASRSITARGLTGRGSGGLMTAASAGADVGGPSGSSPPPATVGLNPGALPPTGAKEQKHSSWEYTRMRVAFHDKWENEGGGDEKPQNVEFHASSLVSYVPGGPGRGTRGS